MKNLKALLMVLVMLVSSVAVVSASNDNGNGHTPVTVCHKTGNGYNEITFDNNAYDAHIKHGDKPAPCPTEEPIVEPTAVPSETPTETPTETPDETPVVTPDVTPDVTPTETPVETPVETPTVVPTEEPTTEPTVAPTDVPIETPTVTIVPTEVPTEVVPVMVAICHYDADTFRWGEIVVNENELEAYFADGDYYAPCDISTEPEAPTEVVPVDICHYDITTGTWNETTVGSDELRDHFGKHGDYMAPCVDGGVDNEPGKETPVNVATPTEAAPVDNTAPNVVPLENGSKSESPQVVTGLPDTGTGFAEGKSYAIVSILVGAIIGGIVTYRMTED